MSTGELNAESKPSDRLANPSRREAELLLVASCHWNRTEIATGHDGPLGFYIDFTYH